MRASVTGAAGLPEKAESATGCGSASAAAIEAVADGVWSGEGPAVRPAVAQEAWAASRSKAMPCVGLTARLRRRLWRLKEWLGMGRKEVLVRYGAALVYRHGTL